MARPRKQPADDDAMPVSDPVMASGINVATEKLKDVISWDNLPDEYQGGKPNPEHDRAILKEVAKLCFNVTIGVGEFPKGFNPDQVKNFVLARAKMRGIEPKGLMDARSEGDKLQDAVSRLLDAPNTLFEATDEELALIDREMNAAVDKCQELIDSRRPVLTLDDEKERERERLRKGKDWLCRVRREVQQREMIRTPRVPKGEDPCRRVSAFKAAKPLLIMVKVQRSSVPGGLREGSDSKVCLVGNHHARFAVDTWEARHGVNYTKKGIVYGEPFKGVLLIAPPGHGKSQFAAAIVGQEFGERPDSQIIYLHAVVDMAKSYMRYITAMCSDDNSTGRRYQAVFPKVRVDHSNSEKLWLKGNDTTKSPNLMAAGVTSAKLGSDSTFQIFDDIVPQSDRDQPTERNRRFETISGTFGTRQRGTKGFAVCIGTLWHNDDALSRFMSLSKNTRYFLVSRQFCGGPNTTPQFFPLWPEVYPAAELRKRFEGMNRDTALWSANYQSAPITDATRLIRSVRLYDPLNEQHSDFMASAKFHVSVDPTATNREQSDHAGVLYGGLGEVRTKRGDDYFYQNRFRFIEAARLHVNQIELTHHIAQYVLQCPVYQVHLEIRSSSGSATRDLLREQYDLEVVEHDPTNIKKGVRLKACAGIIDNSSPDYPAVIEFPGVWDEKGNFVIDPRFEKVVKQLVDFGVEGDDEYVDCTTQLINHFVRAGELVVGEGEASRVVAKAMAQRGDPRLSAFWNKPRPKQNAHQEDDEWFRSQEAM